ncbi:MAG: DNA-formamidopyrimidine glycosylase [Candidatus Paceibacterota bacterium]|jgi:formamidopyrimidine-DNA glycosylase
MPELPEVETTVRGIRKYVVGKKVADCWTDYGGDYHKGKDNIKDKTFFKNFRKTLMGTKIIGADRRAKNVLIHFSNNHTILIHMKMTGHIMYGHYIFDKKKSRDQWSAIDEGPLQDPFNRFIRFVITFSDNTQLVLSDMRKFAKVTLIKTNELETSLHTEHLGPEPLTEKFNLEAFKERLSKRSTWPIKSALMDQTLIAGIGNIYSDEILWRAGVHPESHFKAIPAKQISLIFKAMKETLKKGIDLGGDSMSDYRNIEGKKGEFQEHHQAYRRNKLPCKNKGCGGTIVRKIIRTRSAHFCDTHQKLFV